MMHDIHRSRTTVQSNRSSVLMLSALLAYCVIGGCKPANTNSPASGTAPGSASNAGTSSPAPTGNTIEIGEYGSLTGAQATFGTSTDNAIQLAAEEQNGAGGVNGKQIQIQVEDDQSDASKAETVVNRLIDEKHVIAMLGEVASSASLAGGKVCQDKQIPMISPSSTKTSVTQIGDYIFRVCFIDPFQAAVDARFAHDGLKATRVAIFTNKDQAYSTGFSSDFQDAFKKMGGMIVAQQSYGQNDKDFRGALTAINQANPQVILVPGYYNDAGSIVKQGRELGIKCPFLGGDGWDSEALFQTGGDAVNGCFFSDHMSIDNPSPRVKAFVDAFKAKWGHSPDALAALAYDAAKLMFDAMKRAKSLSGSDIRDAITATKDFPGVTGDITINADRNADKPAVIIAIKNGKFTYDTQIKDPSQPLTP